MTHTATLARHDAFTESLRAADRVIGDEHATPQALQIIEAIKRLRDEKPARVASLNPVDYLTKVQEAARAEWLTKKAMFENQGDPDPIGPNYDATASIDTPLGCLTITTWRTRWNGDRIAWASEYSLSGEVITVAEIKAAGLAQRPTTRTRRKK